MDECIPSGVKPVTGLHLFAKWELDFRAIDPQGNAPFVNVLTADKPSFVLSNVARKNFLYNDGGIQKYGPYSKEYFTPSKPRISVVYQDKKTGQVDQILHKY